METTQVNEKLHCAKCEKDGSASWEVTDGRGHPQRKLVGLTAGFKSVDKGGRDGPSIACDTCGEWMNGS